MREILFKAKRIDNGEWEIGSLVALPNGDYEIANKCQNPPDSDPMWKKCVITHKVDPSTICQYTGLTDKNGQKIWENDVVDLHGYGFGIGNIEIVSYKDGGFYPFMISKWECTPDSEDVEVIGNIFDNPELINE